MKSYCKLLSLVLVFFAMSFAACDTPRTMAWHHYGYAQSKLEEGDLGTTRSMAISLTGNQEYKDNKKYADKVDALLKGIEQAQGPCVDGYVFLYDAMCDESDEGHGYIYDRTGYLDDMDNRNKPQTIKLLESMKEADHEIMDGVMQFTPARYYYLTIEDGRLMRHDYKRMGVWLKYDSY